MELLTAGVGAKFPLARELRDRALTLLRAKTHESGVVTYAELSKAVGVDIQRDHRGRSAIHSASKVLLREGNQKLECVRNVGYRIVRPDEHVAVSRAQQAAARRRLKQALESVTYVALTELSPVDVAKVLQEQSRVAIQLSIGKKLARQKDLPLRESVEVPSGQKLLALMTKKAV